MSPRYILATRIHQDVNCYQYVSDIMRYKQDEFWEAIDRNGGDCEDFVLRKRYELQKAGVPLEDLRIGVCIHPNGAQHAVLVIRDGNVDWVADQTQPALITAGDMKNLGYRGVELQVPGRYLWEKWEI